MNLSRAVLAILVLLYLEELERALLRTRNCDARADGTPFSNR